MSTLDEYKARRAQLIASERALRFDAQAIANATDKEKHAVEIVSALRAKEAKEIWNASTEKLMYPRMEFLIAKETITLEYPPNASSGQFDHRIRLDFTPPSIQTPQQRLVYPVYQRAKSNFTRFAYGGPEGFDKWIVGTMTINPKEAYVDCSTSGQIWEKFFMTFAVAGSIIRYEPILKRYMREVILSSIEDGISYVELRVGFFRQQFKRSKDKMKAENRADGFIGAKAIYTNVRLIENQEMMWYLEDCMALKKEFPDLITGFDLVAQEDSGKPLVYYAELLLWFQEETKRRGLDIPFVFHAGETLDDGGAADSNLYDALLLGTKRIGHGWVKLVRYIQTQYRKRCSYGSMSNIQRDLVLCPDDPSVFGNMGLSFDFFQVIVASEITNLLSLKQLARQSLEYSLLNVDDKKRAIELWEGKWNAYVEHIVSAYSLDEG
ncbi:hypothetical protein B0J17DRAFT_719134 [Rhizoctonia solani]|nr:hypothetical protein B0J17DRAFT_719134 [Rhizoctonia solani]